MGYYISIDKTKPMKTITALDFDLVIEEFYHEMDTATQERMIEIQEVINILQEEKAARNL